MRSVLLSGQSCPSWLSSISIEYDEITKEGYIMKAIAVYPGKPHSMHLEEVPMPRVTDIPNGNGVLVKVLRVGVDGTDKEINAAEYGNAPEGEKFLITGHENFGQVVEVGPNVTDTIRPGAYVVATVRRPGHSIYDQIGLGHIPKPQIKEAFYWADAQADLDPAMRTSQLRTMICRPTAFRCAA